MHFYVRTLALPDKLFYFSQKRKDKYLCVLTFGLYINLVTSSVVDGALVDSARAANQFWPRFRQDYTS